MKREEIVTRYIEEIRAGKRSLEECVAEHPELRGELVEFTDLANRIGSESIMPSAAFKQRARSRLQAVMASTISERKPSRPGFKFRLTARLSYVIITVCLVLTLGGGTVYASQNSLPGETLYPVKTGLENVQINFTTSPESKTRLHIKFTERRVQEVVRESESGKDISASALEAMADLMNNAIQGMNETQEEAARNLLSLFARSTSDHQASLEQISKSAPEAAQPALKLAIDAVRRGNLIALIAGDNPSFLKSGASVFDDELESDYFEIEGTLLGVVGQTWNVGGIQLTNINVPQNPPGIGNTIKLKGVAGNSATFTGRIESEDKAPGDTIIKGVFSGTKAGGSIWIIGGISVGGFQNVTPPQPGTRMEIKGNSQDGIFVPRQEISRGESGSEESENEERPQDPGVSLEADGGNPTEAGTSARNDRDEPRDSGINSEQNLDQSEDSSVGAGGEQDGTEGSIEGSGESLEKSGESGTESGERREKSSGSKSSSGENRERSGDSRDGSGDLRD